MFFGPVSYRFEIAALVLCVEVDKGLGAFAWRLVPDLSEHADINGAHKLLADNIEAVSW